MRVPLLPFLSLVAGLTFSILFTPVVHSIRGQYLKERVNQFGNLPTPLLSALALEFKGVAADCLFLKLTTFTGYKIILDQKLNEEERNIILQGLENITDLDPHFWDPYIFADAEFAWEAGRVKEVEPLLLKAARYKTNDYRPYYFLGFNRFYFLKDSPKAAEYLRLAATKPGCPDYLKNLAARVSVYGNQTAFGIIFLEDLLAETQQGETRKYLAERLEALQGIYTLEKGVLEYYKEFNEKPASLDELVKKGFISELPSDPYGGDFILLPNGRVYTTSRMVTGTTGGQQKKN